MGTGKIATAALRAELQDSPVEGTDAEDATAGAVRPILASILAMTMLPIMEMIKACRQVCLCPTLPLYLTMEE
jgi:hypothetical protein